MQTLKNHIISTLSICAITANLLLWIPGLVLIALIKVVDRRPGNSKRPDKEPRPYEAPRPYEELRPHKQSRLDRFVDIIYRAAVGFDSFWLHRVLRMEFTVYGELPTRGEQPYIIVSNHQSWFDILVLQGVLVPRGPVLKFLVKQELIYVPVVGWICLALGFPRLQRGASKSGRAKDYSSVAAAAASLETEHAGLINFAEGTRFTPAKQLSQQSPYRHLLNPRVGGLKIMLETLPTAHLLDVTLVYPEQNLTFWQCINGQLRQIKVYLSYHEPRDISDVSIWLSERWQEKDRLIAQSIGLYRPGGLSHREQATD